MEFAGIKKIKDIKKDKGVKKRIYRTLTEELISTSNFIQTTMLSLILTSAFK